VAKLANSIFVIAYLSGRVAYMSDSLIGVFVKGRFLEIQAYRRLLFIIKGLLRSLGRPISTGYFPLNKGSSLKNNTKDEEAHSA
jgi:hypothetical protein